MTHLKKVIKYKKFNTFFLRNIKFYEIKYKKPHNFNVCFAVMADVNKYNSIN